MCLRHVPITQASRLTTQSLGMQQSERVAYCRVASRHTSEQLSKLTSSRCSIKPKMRISYTYVLELFLTSSFIL